MYTDEHGVAVVEANADPEQTQSANPASFAPVSSLASERSLVRDPRRYEIRGEHGRGGLGRVSRAYDKDLGRDIAVKELLSRDHLHEQRFAREALITARLEHPGIVPVYEAGRWPDGTPFYAMKLVAGRSLRALLAERSTVAERIVLLHHVIAVADAMAYAHGRNIIHRDLKPANVIVGDFGETVVIDWGLAKDLSDREDLSRGDSAPTPDEDLTSQGSVLGTPAYMPPEQERGERVDRRADVFAIGAMLWELCSLHKVPPADAAQRRRLFRDAGSDPDLVTIIEKALAQDPERRYADAGALAADLRAFKSGARIAARSYSLWAMLAHWTRRNCTLALSIGVSFALAIVGGGVFVRNITTERDRADAAAVTARDERDRTRLSEAALILPKNPNRARELLSSFTTHTAQIALLTDRARHMSATQVTPLAATIHGIFRANDHEALEIRSINGDLHRFDPRTGALTLIDHGLTEAFTYREGVPVYGRRSNEQTYVASPAGEEARSDALTSAEQIVTLRAMTFVLDAAGDLHRFTAGSSEVVEHGIHGIAGDGDVMVICHRDGLLEVTRRGETVLRRRCLRSKTVPAMAVIGDDYAAITESGHLLVSHAGHLRELPTEIRTEYELVMSPNGVVAIADYGAQARTWFARPEDTRMEPGPATSSQPWSLAADGDLVAWGYHDGSITVLDLTTGSTRQLLGHLMPVAYLAIDAPRARVVSSNARELRVWDVAPVPTTRVAALPCLAFRLEPSPDGQDIAFDCNDGSVRVWSRPRGVIAQIQQHAGWTFGPQWLGARVCSASIGDGTIECSGRDGSASEIFQIGGMGSEAPAAAPDHASLIFGAFDGRIWQLDRTLHVLYREPGRTRATAVSTDGRLVASCTEDGPLVVFDRVAHRQIARSFAHPGGNCSVRWVGTELWSSGDDGTVKRWSVDHDELRLRHMTRAAGPLRLFERLASGWVAIEGTGALVASLEGRSVALRVDTGGTVAALATTPDQRYVAAAVDREIIVIDLTRRAVASVAIDESARVLRFVEPGLLAFVEPTALKTLDVAKLDYEPFELVPEPANRASF